MHILGHSMNGVLRIACILPYYDFVSTVMCGLKFLKTNEEFLLFTMAFKLLAFPVTYVITS